MEWILFFVGVVLYCLAAYWTYSINLHNSWWFVPAYILLGTALTGLWIAAVRHMADKQRIYIYSLFWDAMIVIVYVFAPVFMFGVKLDRWSWFAISLIMAGLAIIKMRG